MQKKYITKNNKRVEIPEHWKNRLLQTFLLISVSTLAVGIYLHFASLEPSTEELVISQSDKETGSESNKEVLSASVSAGPSEVSKTIFVDVSGAVANPGVYEIEENSRLTQALEAAGGLAKYADASWVSKYLNLATKLSDGDKIYIPQRGEIKIQPSVIQNQPDQSIQIASTHPNTEIAGITKQSNNIKQEQKESPISEPTSKSENNKKISINTAPASELDTLPGVGEVTAKKIIDNRPYAKLEELKEKKAVNKSTYEKILDKIEL